MSDSYKKIVFSAEEKELLVSLLKQEKVVENKRTNKSTNKLKNEAWDRITKKYNCHAFVTRRDCIQLKRCWEKIKKMRKDAITGEIKSRMATGGGSPLLPSEDYVPGVDEVVPHLMYEIPNTVDCDTVFEIERKTEISKTESEWDPQNSQTSFTIVTTSMPESLPMDCTISENRNSLDRDTTPVRRREERTPVRSQAVLQDCNSSMLGRQLDITQSGWDTQNLQLENSSIVINAESPSLNTATISEVASGPERDTTPLQSHIQSAQCQSVLLNRNSSVRQSRLGPTANNVISARQKNVLKEGEQQQDLYILRRSILLTEEKQALENLRHAKEMNRIKETDELEKLEHQRELRRIELKNLNKL